MSAFKVAISEEAADGRATVRYAQNRDESHPTGHSVGNEVDYLEQSTGLDLSICDCN